MTFHSAIPVSTKLRAAADHLDGLPQKTICHKHGISRRTLTNVAQDVELLVRCLDYPHRRAQRAKIAGIIRGKK